MKTDDLQEPVVRITAPMRTTAGEVLFEIVPSTLDLLADDKPVPPEEIAVTACPWRTRSGWDSVSWKASWVFPARAGRRMPNANEPAG